MNRRSFLRVAAFGSPAVVAAGPASIRGFLSWISKFKLRPRVTTKMWAAMLKEIYGPPMPLAQQDNFLLYQWLRPRQKLGDLRFPLSET